MTARCRGRFAPSPTGDLHLGSVVTALAAWIHARRRGGEFVVRIDDIDPPREVPGAAARIVATLDALGIAGDAPPVFQRAGVARYRDAVGRLGAMNAIYPCLRSRRERRAGGADSATTDAATTDAATTAAAAAVRSNPTWRLRRNLVAPAFIDSIHGEITFGANADSDAVVVRSDGLIGYALACAVDEIELGITDVVRGADLIDATPAQLAIIAALGHRPPRYWHVPVIVDPGSGEKLSKRHRAAAINPKQPADVLRAALVALGYAPGPDLDRDALLAFAVAHVDLSRYRGVRTLTAR